MNLSQIDAGGTVRTLSALTQVDTDGTVRTLKQLWQNDETDTPRLIFSSQTLALTPSEISGYGASNSAIFVISSPATITSAPDGATIVWFSDDATVTPISPGALSTAFRSRVDPVSTKTATIYATVNGAATNSITCNLTNVGTS